MDNKINTFTGSSINIENCNYCRDFLNRSPKIKIISKSNDTNNISKQKYSKLSEEKTNSKFYKLIEDITAIFNDFDETKCDNLYKKNDSDKKEIINNKNILRK
jgi:hypothetical protein